LAYMPKLDKLHIGAPSFMLTLKVFKVDILIYEWEGTFFAGNIQLSRMVGHVGTLQRLLISGSIDALTSPLVSF
jgi:hypothetical protein